MAWSWDHTAEGYANARDRLSGKSRGWLATVLAEWQLQDEVVEYGSVSWSASEVLLNGMTDRNVAKYTHDELVEKVWDKAEAYATCENGGHYLWMCPSGCHMVAPDPVEVG